MEDSDYLETGRAWGVLTGIIAFFGTWWYCAATYGFLWGFGFGWVPSAIVGFVVFIATMLLWGIILFGIIGLAFMYVASLHKTAYTPSQASSPVLLSNKNSVLTDPDVVKETTRLSNGSVTMRVDVDQTGWVTGCAIITSSTSSLLDKKACEIVEEYHYIPSRNADGMNQAATITETLEWGANNQN